MNIDDHVGWLLKASDIGPHHPAYTIRVCSSRTWGGRVEVVESSPRGQRPPRRVSHNPQERETNHDAN